MDDKELFDSAMSAEPVETPAVRPRDEETGRFVPKEPEPEKVAEPEAKPEVRGTDYAEPQPAEVSAVQGDVAVPPGRFRELREERDELRRRLDQERADFMRQMAEVNRPKPEPQPVPDPFENPQAFRDFGVQQAIDPVMQRLQQTTEVYSKRFAVMQHGEEKVKAAYDAIAQGLGSRDPEVHQVYQRAMQSMDPFGEIVTWHQQKTVYSQIGSDPNAWFEKQIAERMKDPTFQSKLLQQIQGSKQPTQGNVINLPPSLNKATGANVSNEALDDSDMSSGALFKHAAAPVRRGR